MTSTYTTTTTTTLNESNEVGTLNLNSNKKLLNLLIEFGGGMELLFSNKHHHQISIPSTYNPLKIATTSTSSSSTSTTTTSTTTKPADIRYLIHYLKTHVIEDKSRLELFSLGESVRPGILVLINSVDWELEDELDCLLNEGDEVVFISTLHGG